METWRRNLYILMVAQFFFMASMSMVIPFLSLFIQELGVTHPDAVSRWAGFIFAANFLTAFIFSPIWGTLADRYGRKIMLLRSGFGMAITVSLMGFVQNPWQLLVLRLLNGMIAGFNPAAVSLIAATTPKERSGYAMGMLQSSGVAGTILGPFFGGLLAQAIGFRGVFSSTGVVITLITVVVMFTVKENFVRPEKKKRKSMRGGFATIMSTQPLPSLFLVGLLIQFAFMSSQPLMPLFIQEMHPDSAYIAFYAGLVAATTGFANMLASPFLGRLGDRRGSQYVLFYSLIGATLFLIPQIFVQSVWMLLISRFFFGMCIGGLIPSVNALIRRFAPPGQESTTFGYSNSALFIGNMLGPILGGLLAGLISIRGVFAISVILFAINTLWMRYVFQHKVAEEQQLKLRRYLLPR